MTATRPSPMRPDAEWFRALVEDSPDVMALIGADGAITYVSPSVTRMFGYAVVEVVGTPLQSFIDSARLPEFVERARSSDASHTESFRVRHASGDWIWAEVSARHGVAPDGSPAIVLTCRDCSDRVLVQEQVEQGRRLNSLSRLAATVSHEFNNVLMGIQPFLHVLQRHGSSDGYVQNIAAQMETSVKRGKQITTEILRFTRPAVPVSEAIGVTQWFREIGSGLRDVLAGMTLRLEIPPGMRVAGDRTQLTQVLQNLAMNAREAMTPGSGVLTIRCGNGTTSRFDFGIVKDAAQYIHISVSDNGKGIAPELLPQIFEPLYTTKRERGTGLGLAIVHQIVRNHNGMIFAESIPGVGTTIHLFLPRAAESTGPLAEPVHARAPVPRTLRRVLIVEDEPAVAEGLAGLLRIHDVDVEVTPRAAMAAAAVARFQPDALILDVALPDGDGIDLYRALAAAHPGLPVVFSTAHETPARLDDVLEQPNVAFLQKPYDESELMEELAKCTAVAPAAIR
jgi:two-component system, cell cycle sensor histidine kinase and response regulator CckA